MYDTTLKEPEVVLTILTSGVLTNKTVWRPCDLFTSPFIMGRVFLDHPGGLRIYSCANCDTPLTNRSELVSTVSGKEGFTVVCVCVPYNVWAWQLMGWVKLGDHLGVPCRSVWYQNRIAK